MIGTLPSLERVPTFPFASRAILGFVIFGLCLFLFGSAALAATSAPGAPGTAGDAGPSDTKSMVTAVGVAVFFSPVDGVQYQVYRHDRTTGRRFVPYGQPLHYQGQGVFTTNERWEDGGPRRGWRYDATYDYMVYLDPQVTDYEEYYYLVASSIDRDIAGRSLSDPNKFLNGYAVTAAFPPTQTRHGNYNEYTNACTACHGLHSGRHPKLLKGPSVTDLCGTCHDGTGSKYDEVRGRVRRSVSWGNAALAAAGPFGDRLKGGSGVQVTSAHNIMRATDPTIPGDSTPATASAQIWQAPGSGWIGGQVDAVQQDLNGSGVPTLVDAKFVTDNWGGFLVCSSCHEPHNKGKNYRILRPVINDRTNIVVRGVSEVNPTAADAADRGDWQQRAMYTKYLGGGNSVLTYNEVRVEDPAWNPAGADADDMDGDGNRSEIRAQAYCDHKGGSLATGDATSPTGFRCRVPRSLGGVATFCTACHRGFMSADAPLARNSYAYTNGSGTLSGYDVSSVSNSGGGPVGLATSMGAFGEEVLGQHRHPISMPAADALRNGRIVDGPLGPNGDVCAGTCGGVSQGRVVDPLLPLEGQEGDGAISANPYVENLVTCLTCHVPHGSGSERIEVAYQNGSLNDSVGMLRDGVSGYLRSDIGVSSVLARFQPFASACYRCHSATPGA